MEIHLPVGVLVECKTLRTVGGCRANDGYQQDWGSDSALKIGSKNQKKRRLKKTINNQLAECNIDKHNTKNNNWRSHHPLTVR
jgi:hypothetical protein